MDRGPDEDRACCCGGRGCAVSQTGGLRAIPRCTVLGVGISALNLPQAVEEIRRCIESQRRMYVCVTGVHGVMESQRDPQLKAIHNAAGMVTPDGMPMVWLGQLAGFGQMGRVYGPELMLEVCRASVGRGFRHFLYGGGPGVAELLAQRLHARFPGIRIAGTWCPPFRAMSATEDQQAVEAINNSGADIVWVGLSTPKQERWMAQHRERLEAGVLIGVGAAFDFHAGLKRQAPRWIQHSGLEWAFRLASEPRRLWKRYAVNNPLFLFYLLNQWLGWRDFGQIEGSPEGGIHAS